LVKNQIAHGRHIILSNSLYRVIIALMSKIKVLILAGILVLIIGAVRGYTGYFDDIASINTIYPTTTPSPTPTLTPTPTPTMTPTPTPTLVPPTPTSLPVVNYEELFETYANHYSVDKDILKRIKDTKPQYKLSKEDRKKNILGALKVAEKFENKLNGKTIILIDDITTTFATLQECAKVLKKSGAVTVVGITVAKEA